MTQPFLQMRTRSTASSQCAVFKEIDMQLVQVGGEFGTDDSDAPTGPTYNRVIHWENDLYAINRSTIYKYDVANSGSWEPFYTFLTPRDADAISPYYRLGFTPASVDGSGVLFCGYVSNNSFGDRMRFVTIDKAGNVTESAEFTLNNPAINFGAGPVVIGPGVAWRNSVIFLVGSISFGNVSPCKFDLKTGSFQQINTPGAFGLVFNDQLCVAKDKVWHCGFRTFTGLSNPVLQLHRLDGSTMVLQDTIGTQGHGNTQNTSQFGGALCNIGDKLFVFYPGGGGGTGAAGWHCYEILLDNDGNYVSHVDVTSVVIPSQLQANNINTEAGLIRIDTVTNGPENPIYEFLNYNNNAEGSSIDLYRWNNAPSGALTFVDAGMDNKRFSRISTNDGTGGGRIWSGSGTLNVSQPDLSLDGFNINAELTVYGGLPGTGVGLELFYGKDGGITDTKCTLDSTSHGSLSGNAVVGLSADGVTKVTVGWSAALDGIVAGDNPKVAARVFLV